MKKGQPDSSILCRKSVAGEMIKEGGGLFSGDIEFRRTTDVDDTDCIPNRPTFFAHFCMGFTVQPGQ